MSGLQSTHLTDGRAERLTWIDACRVYAALGVVLIHCTTDSAGQPFASATPAERTGPAILRLVSELSGSELFFVFSLFLIAWKLDRRGMSYGHFTLDQARRLLIPFLAWTLFYAFFRLFKADAFNYAPAILAELGRWQSWANYILLGSAQYQLHFLPSLFFLGLLYPLMKPAVRFPMAGLFLIGALYIMNEVQSWIWGTLADPMSRDLLLRVVKILGYAGYGLAAFSLYGLWKSRMSVEASRDVLRLCLLVTALLFLATFPYGALLVKTGTWAIRPPVSFYGHLLIPVAVFGAFLATQYFSWSPVYSRIARYTFGFYLAHPIAIDLYDVGVHRLGWQIDPTVMVLTKFLFAVPLTLAFSVALGRFHLTAWLIGLGPVPNPGRLLSSTGKV